MRTIYLAGGFRTGWQRRVHDRLGRICEVLDPSLHGLTDPAAYTTWDLEAIKRSDAVLAVMEGTNPGGFALALEIGFAKALGKTVYLVDELIDGRAQYFAMVRHVVDQRFGDLDSALDALEGVVRELG